MLKTHNLFLFFGLMFFWLVFSPYEGAITVISGAGVALLVVVLSQDIVFKLSETSLYHPRKILTLLRFTFVLFGEIIKANIEVALIVLNPKLPIEPCFVKVPLRLKEDLNKVIYANAVTLTPGTLTVDITEEGFLIHALTENAAASLPGHVIEKYVLELDGESDD